MGVEPQLEGEGRPEVAEQVRCTVTGHNTHILLRTPSPPGAKDTVLCPLQVEAEVRMTVGWKIYLWGLVCPAP